MGRQAPSAADIPWTQDHGMRVVVREVMGAEHAVASRMRARDEPGRRARQLRIDSAERIRTLLRGRPAAETPDLAMGAHCLARVLKATGTLRGNVSALLAAPAAEEHIRRYLLEQALLPLERSRARHELLRESLLQRSQSVRLEPCVVDELFALWQTVAARLGDEYAPTVYLLFLLTGDIRKTHDIVQCHTAPLRGEGEAWRRQESWFFREVLEMAGYAERLVHMQSGAGPGRRTDATRHQWAVEGLPRILHDMLDDPSVRTRDVDLRKVAAALRPSAGQALLPLRHTTVRGPFAGAKSGRLWMSGLSVHTHANVLERMDAEEEYSRVLQCASSLFQASQSVAGKDEPLWFGSQAQDALASLVNALEAVSTRAVAELMMPLFAHFPGQHPLPGAEVHLRLWLQEQHRPALERSFAALPKADRVFEQALLLGVIDAKRIVNEQVAQDSFLDLYDSLMRSDVPCVPAIRAHLEEALQGNDAYFMVPLAPCTRYPQYRGRTIRELLEMFAVRMFPERWRGVIPPLSQDAIGIDPSMDFSGAIEPVYERREDLQEVADTLKRDWGDEKFRKSWSLLEAELRQYLRASRHRIMPHLSATALFNYILEGLFDPPLHGRWNVVLSTREYEDMFRGKVSVAGGCEAQTDPALMGPPLPGSSGRAQPRFVARTNEKGDPVDREVFLADLLRKIDSDTKCIVLSVVSRYGDVLFGRDKDPASELALMLGELRRVYPQLLVILDACQAVGRVSLPAVDDLDDHTILLCTGGKALGVSQFGFAAVPDHLAWHIQTGHGYETQLPPDTLRTTSMLMLFLRLRELQSVYRRSDTLGSAGETHMPPGGHRDAAQSIKGDAPMQERVAARVRKLTARAVRNAGGHAKRVYRVTSALPILRGLRSAEACALLQCRVFAPSGHLPRNCPGIISLHFPTLPAEHLAAELVKRGCQHSGVRMEGTCLRIAFNEFQKEEHVDTLFDMIFDIHAEYLQHATGPLQPSVRTPEMVERSRIDGVSLPS